MPTKLHDNDSLRHLCATDPGRSSRSYRTDLEPTKASQHVERCHDHVCEATSALVETPPLDFPIDSRWRHVIMRKLSQSNLIVCIEVATAFGVRISLIKSSGSVSVPMNADDSRQVSALSHLSPIDQTRNLFPLKGEVLKPSLRSSSQHLVTESLRDCHRSVQTQTYELSFSSWTMRRRIRWMGR